MNFYNDANPDLSKVTLVRELVRLKAAQMQGLDYGFATTNDPETIAKAKADWEAKAQGLVLVAPANEPLSIENARKIALDKMKKEKVGKRVNLEFAENLAAGLKCTFRLLSGSHYRKI